MKAPVELQLTSAMAPGGGAPPQLTTATGSPTSPRRSASRAPLPRRARSGICATPSSRVGQPAPGPACRQDWLAPAERVARRHRPSRRPGCIGLPGELERPRGQPAGPSTHGRQIVAGQSFGSRRPRRELGPPFSAWRHRSPAASAMSPGSSRTSSVPGSRWSSAVDGARWAAHTSRRRRPRRARRAGGGRAGRGARPTVASLERLGIESARSAASRSGRRAAARPRRSRIAAEPPAGRRNSVAGRSTADSIVPTVRWSVGSNERSESISSPKNSIRIGRVIDGGKTSTIPPRRADSPRPATSVTGT